MILSHLSNNDLFIYIFFSDFSPLFIKGTKGTLYKKFSCFQDPYFGCKWLKELIFCHKGSINKTEKYNSANSPI